MSGINAVKLIGSANLITITDHLGEMYALLEPQISTDDTGIRDKTVLIKEILLNHGDNEEMYTVITDLLAPIMSFTDKVVTANVMRMLFQTFVQSLNAHCQQRGVNLGNTILSLDTYATYVNGAGDFNDFLYSPEFAALYLAVISSGLTAANVFSPEIKHGGTYTNAMGKCVITTGTPVFTDGALVDTAKYLGAVPKLHVESGGIVHTGTDTIVITVTGTDHEGTTTAEWVYTGSADADIAAGDYNFTAGGDMYIQNVKAVTGIAITGATSGTFYVEGWEPSRA